MDNAPTLRQLLQTGLGLGLVSFSAWVAEQGRPSDRWMVLAGGIGGTASMVHAVFGKRSRKLRPSAEGLDRVLLHWDDENAFTVRDLLNSAAIFGRTGSGKTSSSGRAIAEAVVRLPGSGGLIVAAKPGEDRAFWEGVFQAAGRSDDLLVFSPDHPLRCNLLDYEMRQGGGHTRNITKTLTTISETLRSSDTDNRESSDFWQKEQERMLFNAVEVVKLSTGGVSAPDLHKFIGTAALTPSQFTSEAWLAGFHNQCLKKGWETPKPPIGQHDFDLAKEYWLGEFPNMADKTRSSILTGVMGILHTFNTGIVRELVSTTTNVTPDDLFRGKFIFVDMPVSELGDVGAFVSGGLKYLCQRAILRRKASESSNVTVIWADEAQGVVTSFDAPFLAQCRSHRGCAVYISQSLPGYYAALGGETGKRSIDALLTNFSTKVFHALGDLDTAQWASGLVGRSIQTLSGGSATPQEDGVYGDLMGRSRYSSSFSQAFESTLQANAFLHGLRCGGAANGLMCDAYVIRTGEPFASGENWLRTSFSQKGGRS
jgi:hypothetical protein